jgi:hypothetical protein
VTTAQSRQHRLRHRDAAEDVDLEHFPQPIGVDGLDRSVGDDARIVDHGVQSVG